MGRTDLDEYVVVRNYSGIYSYFMCSELPSVYIYNTVSVSVRSPFSSERRYYLREMATVLLDYWIYGTTACALA